MLSIDFEPLYRSSIGFEPIFSLLESAIDTASSWESYPPYNIEQRGEDRYRLTLNVAGFRQDELAVETQQSWLVVSGHKAHDAADGRYLYQGFALRDFERRFQLADYVEVEGATLADGLLTVELVRELPEAMKPRRIEIGAPKIGLVQKAKKLLDQAA
ncbi:MAG TPA: Hsp20 family protein [Stellaceae bacterium]|nr:Hsp20 family protein [Stellaceae bacterium]